MMLMSILREIVIILALSIEGSAAFNTNEIREDDSWGHWALHET